MTKLTYTEALTVIDCGVCHVRFALPEQMEAARRKDGKDFWCPNGDKVHYTDSENTRLQRQLERAEARAVHAEDQRRAAERKAATAKREAAAAKGQVTKARKRARGGCCPEPTCGRTFVDVAAHVRTKHPELAAEGVPA